MPGCRKLLLEKQSRQQFTYTTECGTTGGGFGARPGLGHLRAFGLRVDYQRPSKADPRGEEGVHLGYDEARRAYKIYNKVKRTVVATRDAKFDERLRGWDFQGETL